MMTLWLGIVSQLKGLSNIEGDMLGGRRSSPVVWGEDVSLLVFSGAALCLGGGYILSAALLAPSLLSSAFILASGAVALAVITLGPWSKGDKSRRRKPYQAFMLTKYGATILVVTW
jgi:4-hydroxybenzoate polyprenyltransferase